MLDINGWPILAYNLQLLADAGFDRITLNLHYLPEVVRSFVGTGSRWGVDVRYSDEPELLGTSGALVPLASEFCEQTFAVVFGDNIGQIDLRAMLATHRRSEATVTVALWQRPEVTQSGVAELEADGRIIRFLEKPAPGETSSTWVNAGYLIVEPTLLDDIPRDRASDFGRDILPAAIARGERVQGYRMTGNLWWFDRVEEYMAALTDPELRKFTSTLRAQQIDA
jgi:NDP-sugar pyrophosphorylase family protein